MTSNIALKGKLSFLNLGELLQLFGGSGSTGILKIISTHVEGPGYVYIVDGNPVDAEHQGKKGIDTLNSFFGWLDAEFEFSDEKIYKKRSIKKNRMEIILDGLRKLDDGMIKKLGSTSSTQDSEDEVKDESGVPVIKGPLVDYLYIVDEDQFTDGQEIVVQEKFGNWLWVVLEGELEVIRLAPEGETCVVKLADGSFIGGISSLKEKSNVRSATVRAVGRVQLGVLDYHRVLEEFNRISDDFKEILSSFENRVKQITSLCGDAVYNKVKLQKDMGELIPFPYYENNDDDDEKVFKITKGSAVIVREVNKQYLPVSHLGVDDVVGNIPFLNTAHEPHSASVFVSEDLETVEIDLIDIKEDYDQLSNTLKNMILHTSTSTSITTGRLIDLIKKNLE